jgi:hypothetical protein
MRRILSFLLASTLLLAGLALAANEIVRAEGIRPFLLVGAGLMIGAAGVWLFDEVRPPVAASAVRPPSVVSHPAFW